MERHALGGSSARRGARVEPEQHLLASKVRERDGLACVRRTRERRCLFRVGFGLVGDARRTLRAGVLGAKPSREGSLSKAALGLTRTQQAPTSSCLLADGQTHGDRGQRDGACARQAGGWLVGWVGGWLGE